MKNSNLLVSDDAIFEIKSEQDKQKVLTYISADEWISPYIYECHALELPDAPLFFGQFKQDFMVEMPTGTYRVPPLENSDEELSETARDTGLILVYPEKGHLVAKPTRYTAFTTMCARAGISGSTICNSQKKPLLNVLPLAEKATWLSRGFSLHLAPCKILYRDGKVSSMLSAEYEVLPADMAVPAFEDRIKKDHPALELSAGMLSHEYLYLDYLFSRAFAGALILIAHFMLNASYAADLKFSSFFAFMCFVVGTIGIFISAKPHWMRDWIRKIAASTIKSFCSTCNGRQNAVK